MLENRIDRVTVKNYRSLADVTVELEDLTVLVGPNGSGKSNLLDVLRFVSDALRNGLESAVRERLRYGDFVSNTTSSSELAVSLDLSLYGQSASYSFTLENTGQNFVVVHEAIQVGIHRYEVNRGRIIHSTNKMGLPSSDRNLALVVVGSFPEFRTLYRYLTDMGFYSILPDALRLPQAKSVSYPLAQDGSNFASVMYSFLTDTNNKAWKEDLFAVFAQIVPGLQEANPIIIKELDNIYSITLQYANGQRIGLGLESDGTLRALGLLMALYQKPPLPLIGIEEPELMLHPGVMGVFADVFYEGSHRNQIVLTTHSPDLISRFAVESLRIVDRESGTTQIGIVREADRLAIEDKLFSGGDLLRLGALRRG